MTKSAEMLLKKMGEDKSFAEKILSQTEKEKVIEIARGEGIELTMEDIDEINESIVKALQQKKEGELSEEELESVAGGINFDGWKAMTATVKAKLTAVEMSVINISLAVVAELPTLEED
jgi:predicted ribosomally synthesized peptide with nif11-like leader